jgi:hypothetical protein
MSELFDIPESKSPRLLWLEKHGVKFERDFFDPWEEETYQWMAHMRHHQGFGKTQDEAITDLAKTAGILTWVDEKLTK